MYGCLLSGCFGASLYPGIPFLLRLSGATLRMRAVFGLLLYAYVSQKMLL